MYILVSCLMVIKHFCTLQNVHPIKSSYPLSPYRAIPILLTVVSMLYITFSCLFYLTPVRLYHLISITYSTHPLNLFSVWSQEVGNSFLQDCIYNGSDFKNLARTDFFITVHKSELLWMPFSQEFWFCYDHLWAVTSCPSSLWNQPLLLRIQ